MTVLSDREILDKCRKGWLISEGFMEDNVTPNGYDLTIELIRHGDSEAKTPMDIPPMGNFLVGSREFMNLPSNVCAQIFIKSSMARKGIFGSFGFIDAGFRGNLTLAFCNMSKESVRIEPGKKIAQVIFLTMDFPAVQTYGKRSGNFQDSRGIQTDPVRR
ncbi:MAG: dCTP deaminase [Candidatus Thermoplasmatota archaeon]|jgi:dCTP deaminase|nr:dCTP deaminase [Candidatus Thermoplasmatota archaeon]MCL5794580.1 dCTP deaminase [Candidatus Thermoplasmatota archaeon]